MYADEYAELNFYVKLRVGANEVRLAGAGSRTRLRLLHHGRHACVHACVRAVRAAASSNGRAARCLQIKTDIVKGTSQPKFLKDCRLAVPSPETDYLRVCVHGGRGVGAHAAPAVCTSAWCAGRQLTCRPSAAAPHDTITIRTAPAPRFLQIELMQVGQRGDLVVGSDELRVLTVTAKGTIVHWFELKTASQEKTAELCLVLRYLSGARPTGLPHAQAHACLPAWACG